MVHDYRPPVDWADQFNRASDSGLEYGTHSVTNLVRYRKNKIGPDLTPEKLAFYVDMYDASIRTADEMFAELLEHLDQLNLLDRTIIVITSDHGEEFLEHGCVLHMTSLYEELIQVPLIIKVPGIQGAREIDTFLSQIDVMPTLLDLMNVDCPSGLQGRSFARILTGSASRDRTVFAEVNISRQIRRTCIIEEGWKYIEGDTEKNLKYPAPSARQLFNLNVDPREQKDMSDQKPGKEENLRNRMQMLQKELQKARDTRRSEDDSSSVSPELMEMLRQQGYL
jgi:arylsulfatase A-like enzyme